MAPTGTCLANNAAANPTVPGLKWKPPQFLPLTNTKIVLSTLQLKAKPHFESAHHSLLSSQGNQIHFSEVFGGNQIHFSEVFGGNQIQFSIVFRVSGFARVRGSRAVVASVQPNVAVPSGSFGRRPPPACARACEVGPDLTGGPSGRSKGRWIRFMWTYGHGKSKIPYPQ